MRHYTSERKEAQQTRNESSHKIDGEDGAFERAYETPIAFYGKVVDENNKPLPGALIKLMAADKPWENSSIYSRVSDSTGMFSLVGAKGAALSINVEKEGYYSSAATKRRYVYGGVRGMSDPKNPTSEAPAIFVLRKIVAPADLVHSGLKAIKLPKDGSPVEVRLATGTIVGKGEGDLIVECQTSNAGMNLNLNPKYPWHAKLSIPGGGLTERGSDSDFVAPETGYRPIFEIDMPSSSERWRRGFERDFFARLADGRYARLRVELHTGGDHFIAVDAFVNPTIGDRNLMSDSPRPGN